MGTLLGVLFIAMAAAAGVFVGTRPTVMDGRWMASRLSEMAGGEGTIWCDREIRLGVAGAEFSCTHAHEGGRRQVWYRLTRTGALESLRSGPLTRGPGDPGEPDAADVGAGAGGGGGAGAGAEAGDEAEAAGAAGAGDAGDEAEATSEEAPPARKPRRERNGRGRGPSAEKGDRRGHSAE